MNLNPHYYRIYLCVWYVIFAVKNVNKTPFLHFFAPPLIPLVKCECIFFGAKVCIWIKNLREKYGTKFGFLIYYQNKVLIFRLIITNFGTLRMHQTAPFLSTFTKPPLAQVIINIIPGLPTHLVCNSLSR